MIVLILGVQVGLGRRIRWAERTLTLPWLAVGPLKHILPVILELLVGHARQEDVVVGIVLRAMLVF